MSNYCVGRPIWALSSLAFSQNPCWSMLWQEVILFEELIDWKNSLNIVSCYASELIGWLVSEKFRVLVCCLTCLLHNTLSWEEQRFPFAPFSKFPVPLQCIYDLYEKLRKSWFQWTKEEWNGSLLSKNQKMNR